MKIDFADIKELALEGFKGGEGTFKARIVKDPDGRGMMLKGSLEPGASLGLHTHETSFEVFYIISGTGTCLYDDAEPETLPAGTAHLCPKGHTHSLRNDSNELLEFFAIVPEV